MSFKSWFRKNFLAGIIVLVPLMATLALFRWLFDKITRTGYEWLLKHFADDVGPFLQKNQLLFRVLVLFLMVGLTVLIGLLARNFVGRRVIRLGETVFERLPIVNRIYKAFKQISEAFWGQNKTSFDRVVAVEYPRKGVYTIGLVTSPHREGAKDKTGERLISVLLPTTPNPTSGCLVIVPERDTVRLDMTVEDALKVVISGGAVAPKGIKPLFARDAAEGGQKEASHEEEVPTSQNR